MKKLKKKVTKLRPRKRVRRNPMARALEMAEKKHEGAVLEWQKCVGRIQFLKEEIPRLEGIIRALGGVVTRGATGVPVPPPMPENRVSPDNPEELDQTAAILQHPLTERVATGTVPGAVVVPAHLQHMIKEHPLVLKGAGDVQGQIADVQFPED